MCIDKNNLKDALKKHKTYTYSNLSKKVSDLKNIKTEAYSLFLNSISNP
jgi:hypothetical protein